MSKASIFGIGAAVLLTGTMGLGTYKDYRDSGKNIAQMSAPLQAKMRRFETRYDVTPRDLYLVSKNALEQNSAAPIDSAKKALGAQKGIQRIGNNLKTIISAFR